MSNQHQYTDDAILNEVKHVTETVDGTPTVTDFINADTAMSFDTVQRRIGWDTALEELGYDTPTPIDKQATVQLTAELMKKVNGDLTGAQFEAHPDTPSKSHAIKQFGSWDALIREANEYAAEHEIEGESVTVSDSPGLNAVLDECCWRIGHYTHTHDTKDLPVRELVSELQAINVPDHVIAQGISEYLQSEIHRGHHPQRHPVTEFAAAIYSACKGTDHPILPEELTDAFEPYGVEDDKELISTTREIERANNTPRLQPSVDAYLNRFIDTVETHAGETSDVTVTDRDIAIARHAAAVASDELPNRNNAILAAGSILASFDRDEHSERPIPLNDLAELLAGSEVTLNRISRGIRDSDAWSPTTVPDE